MHVTFTISRLIFQVGKDKNTLSPSQISSPSFSSSALHGLNRSLFRPYIRYKSALRVFKYVLVCIGEQIWDLYFPLY